MPDVIGARRVAFRTGRPTATPVDLRIAMCTASEAEDEREGNVDGAQLAGVEAPGGSPEALGIDDGRLLDEHACVLVFETDRWAKARRSCARRGRGDECRAEVEELLGLNNDGVARPALLSTVRAAGGGQAEDLAADHVRCWPTARALPSARG